MTHAEPAVVL